MLKFLQELRKVRRRVVMKQRSLGKDAKRFSDDTDHARS